MNIRVEIFKSKSMYYPLVLDICRRQVDYECTGDKHCVEFDAFTEDFKKVMNLCRGWKGAFFYLDDKAMGWYDM